MKTLIIARHTVREAVRKRIVLAGLILTSLFLLLYGIGAHFVFTSIQNTGPGGGVSAQALRDFEAAFFLFMGLFVANMAGALAAVFTGCGTISTEVEQGTLQSIATRPITRAQIIFGKWLGNAVLLSVYMAVFYISIVMIIYNSSRWYPNNIFFAGVAFTLEILVVLSVVIFGGTFMPTAANAVTAVMLFMTALIGGIMEQVSVFIGKKALFTTGTITSLIMPTDTLYRYAVNLLKPVSKATSIMPAQMMDFGPFGAPSPPSGWMLLYVVIFCTALVAGAAEIFSRRDL